MINYLNNQQFTVDSLNKFISANISEIYDYFKFQNHLKLKEQEKFFESFLLNNNVLIRKLDYSIVSNKVFLDIILDACEQLYFPAFYQTLIQVKKKNSLIISSRQEASLLYLTNIRNFGDFEAIIDSFLEKLEEAFLSEEDNNKRLNYIFFNLYSRIIRDFSSIPDRLKTVIQKLNVATDNYSFIDKQFSKTVFQLNINEKDVYDTIQQLSNELLGKRILESFNPSDYLIEQGTEYSSKLNGVAIDINAIRELSVNLFNRSTEIYDSLGRGVAVLTEYQQLYAYLNSFGPMHFKKCNTAFENLPSDFFSKEIQVIDWGAGQGLASMTYLNFIKNKNAVQIIQSVTLNEPSEIALKRGALHVKKFNSTTKIKTINKKLDSLVETDFAISEELTKLHLFSNILDIEDYSSTKLINLVSNAFRGENYFVIISPYITDIKNNRIQLFVDSFKKHPSFAPIYSFEKMKNEWFPGKTWSIFLRIFKVNIL